MDSLVTCLVLDAPASRPGVLEVLARSCSPRVEMHGSDAVIIDTQGLARVCGPPDVVAQEIVHLASTQGLIIRLATASTRTAAWLLAHARAGITVVESGGHAAALASLPIGWLGVVIDLDQASHKTPGVEVPHPVSSVRPKTPGVALQHPVSLTADAYRERFAIFERWGVRTLGQLAAIPRQDIHARMGSIGVRLHQAATGEDIAPLVPVAEARPFADRIELEWPIEGLEPLSFVLSRQFDRLSATLDEADRGAVTVITRLALVTKAVHERTLNLPAPLKDAKVLRTLVLLDLESHPPPAAIDVVDIVLEVTPGPILQGSLLAQSLPSTEDVTTLIARLGALMGESRVGAPALVDTHDPRLVAMRPFQVPTELRKGFRLPASKPGSRLPAPGADSLHLRAGSEVRSREPEAGLGSREPLLSFRRFRVPLTARVTVERGMPIRVVPSGRGLEGGAVVASAGPWRTSGAWWTFERAAWDRDEWDVALAPGGVYRLARNRVSGTWEIEGLFD